ncbi:MAG TPA: aldo/keto reductase [Clostridiales bacterium]|nr:aldo/keto reductase [Clostridiales bacterium]HXK83701.1 aldo/keto reductase [Clostridiales bacterium]
MKSLTDSFVMHNGVKIPCVGFGTWQIPEGETVINSAKKALEAGYRHIDTAAIYRNEVGVGTAVKESGIPREEIFITSKLWNSDQGYDMTLKAFDATMERLGLEYLDLYLIHWPIPRDFRDSWQTKIKESWRAMEKLYKEGRIKAIGVSNFLIHHFEALLEDAEIVPMVNQVEIHPGFNQSELVQYCHSHGVVVEAWSPLGSGKIMADPTLKEVADKYGRTPAQVTLRWLLQRDILPLPRSTNPEHIAENARIFDFELSDEDMGRISSISAYGRLGGDPDNINF